MTGGPYLRTASCTTEPRIEKGRETAAAGWWRGKCASQARRGGATQIDLGEVGAGAFSFFGVARSESRVSGPGVKAGEKSIKRPYDSTGYETVSIVSATNL